MLQGKGINLFFWAPWWRQAARGAGLLKNRSKVKKSKVKRRRKGKQRGRTQTDGRIILLTKGTRVRGGVFAVLRNYEPPSTPVISRNLALNTTDTRPLTRWWGEGRGGGQRGHPLLVAPCLQGRVGMKGDVTTGRPGQEWQKVPPPRLTNLDHPFTVFSSDNLAGVAPVSDTRI